MSAKKTIGYYVANRPGIDMIYRVRVLHEGETAPEGAYWSGLSWYEAEEKRNEANAKRREEDRGRNVWHVIPYVYYMKVKYTCERRHYRFAEEPPVLPNEIMHSDNYYEARTAMEEENRRIKREKQKAEIQAKLDFLAGRIP